jgi:hypothetical protein
VKQSRKKMAASQPVILVSTLVVWAPKMFSVTPPPKAAPRPSLLGRCIKITRIISNATKTKIPLRMLMARSIGTGNMAGQSDL